VQPANPAPPLYSEIFIFVVRLGCVYSFFFSMSVRGVGKHACYCLVCPPHCGVVLIFQVSFHRRPFFMDSVPLRNTPYRDSKPLPLQFISLNFSLPLQWPLVFFFMFFGVACKIVPCSWGFHPQPNQPVCDGHHDATEMYQESEGLTFPLERHLFFSSLPEHRLRKGPFFFFVQILFLPMKSRKAVVAFYFLCCWAVFASTI